MAQGDASGEQATVGSVEVGRRQLGAGELRLARVVDDPVQIGQGELGPDIELDLSLHGPGSHRELCSVPVGLALRGR